MININRHNYETFFLLYTDNELSVEEKNMVDDFVEANPDLQEELVMLQQSILKPDHIIFEDKVSLHKEGLIPTELQQQLLLHLDDELTAGERSELDGLIKADADIEKEWRLLQQTKFSSAEVVLFEEKQSLYRNEGGRLVALPWLRLAAAAILIGLGIWGGVVYLNGETKIGERVIAKSSPKKPDPIVSVKEDRQPAVAAVTTTQIQEVEITPKSIKTQKKSTEIINEQPGNDLQRTLSPNDRQVIAIQEKTNNLPKSYLDNVNNKGSNILIAANVKPQTPVNNIVNPGNNVIDIIGEKKAPANSFVSNASFIDNGEENNNRVLYMDEEKIKKTKLGGIFRKVKRVLERNANIKSGGNNIKVANLEFAIQ